MPAGWMAAASWAIFHRIMMPIASQGHSPWASSPLWRPGITSSIAYILITTRDKYTLPMLIQTLRGDVYRP